MSRGVSQNYWCDWCVWSRTRTPSGDLLDGDREDPVVAPRTVDVQEARGVAHLLEAELLHDAQRVGVLRPYADLDPVQAHAVRGSGRSPSATARGATPRPADLGGDPVADRGPLRRAAGHVADRDLAGETSVHLDDERQALAQPGLVQQGPRDDLVRTTGAAPCPAARWRPTAAASRGCGRGRPATRRRPTGAAARTTTPSTPAGRASRGRDPAGPLSGRSRRPAPPRGARRARGRRGASFTPPREPGRLTTRQSPATPARPRESIAVGTPLATPAARIASAMPGHLAVEQRPRSPRASGRWGSGRCRRW